MNTLTKISILAASTFTFVFSATAQSSVTYKVVKVQGEIVRVKTGNSLSIGENVVSNENLSFKDNYSRAMVVNKEKGCIILSANSSNGGPQFLPAPNNMSVRSAVPTQPSEVLDFYYGFVAIIGCDSLKIDDYKLPINSESYFTVNYNVNGQEVTDKMVFKNGKLALPETLIQNKPDKIEVCYNNEFGLRKKSEFKPIYVDNENLKREIALILNTIPDNNDDRFSVSFVFVNDFYGKTTPESVESWVNKNFK